MAKPAAMPTFRSNASSSAVRPPRPRSRRRRASARARVFIVASKSLAGNTPVVRTIADALGSRYVGLFDGCVQHSPRASCHRSGAGGARGRAGPHSDGRRRHRDRYCQSPANLPRAWRRNAPKGSTACTFRSQPTAKGMCRISARRRCARWSCRPRCPAPSSQILPASPTNVSAKNIPSSVRMSARVPSSSIRR